MLRSSRIRAIAKWTGLVVCLALLAVNVRVLSLSPGLDVGFFIDTPFWLFLIVAALPTAFLFWRDSRYPPGHCQRCGYDLTGNVSSVCPECGRAT